MMKATAIAPANIAFIKYWGKADKELRLPLNSSISMNLSACTTTTTIEFSNDFKEDFVTEGFGKERIFGHVDRLRKIAKSGARARVTTENNFPKSSGVASSASGFAALTVAAAAALGLTLSEKELSAFARLGSGSACRSIPDGFVEWHGTYAYSLYPPDYWDLCDILLVAGSREKEISSTAGMEKVKTSPLWEKRIAAIPKRILRLKQAFQDKNFPMLGEIIEEDCLDMHAVMQTQSPPLFYWNEKTKEIMQAVINWRKSGLPVYFTIDAGPNVHLICQAEDEEKVVEALGGRYQIIINKPARGAHLV